MEAEIKLNTTEIITRLAKLQSDINYIKDYIEDITLTKDDIESLEEAEKEFNEGRTISLDNLKKDFED